MTGYNQITKYIYTIKSVVKGYEDKTRLGNRTVGAGGWEEAPLTAPPG